MLLSNGKERTAVEGAAIVPTRSSVILPAIRAAENSICPRFRNFNEISPQRAEMSRNSAGTIAEVRAAAFETTNGPAGWRRGRFQRSVESGG